MKIYLINKKWKSFLLNEGVNPRWLDGRLFVAFQPAFDVVVAGKYGVLLRWVSKSDESRRWEFELKSNN